MFVIWLQVHYALAWGNINLFDFNDRLQDAKVRLRLWPMPQGLDDTLNVIGIPGSNPNSDSPCLELEFTMYNKPVSFPSDEQIMIYAGQSNSGYNMVRMAAPESRV